jgi:hypothetical protein
MKERGVKLTDSGMRCCNPACGQVLYVELMADTDAEACFECDPEQFREGWSPAFVELFERSGERLPTPDDLARWAEYEGTAYFNDAGAPYCEPHCTEACCRKKAA